MIRFFLVAIFLLTLNSLQAQETIVLTSEENREVGKYTQVFPDKEGKLKIEDVINLNKFETCDEDVYAGEYNVHTYWVKFKVKNTTNNNYYLAIDNALIDTLDLYTETDGKFSHVKKSGSGLPFSARDIPVSTFMFKVDLPKNQTKTFYIKYSANRKEIPLSISTLKRLDERAQLRDLLTGIFLGILILSILYNFIMYLILGDACFFYYSSYIFWLGIFRSITFGYFYQYFSSQAPHLNRLLYFGSLFLTGLFLILFVMDFLQTRQRIPKLHKLGYGVIILYAIGFVISITNELIGHQILTITTLLSSFYIVFVAIIILKQGYKPAKYYLIAAMGFLFGVLVADLRILGFIPYNFFTVNSINFGIILETVLFSLALGHRYRVFEDEKRQIQEALNMELEKKIVEKRKVQKEQSKLNQELKNSHTDLDNFIYTASHDLKAPVINIEGLLTILKKDLNDRDDVMNILGMMSKSIDKFRDTIDDLIDISKVQRMRDEDLEINDIKETIKEVELNLQPQIKYCDATIELDVSGHPSITFSKRNFYRILESLVSNAIKFHSPERKPVIKIKTFETDDYTILEVRDNGMGISAENQKKIFSLFKRYNDKIDGRGLGLYITKRIIDNSGGKIEVESEEIRGSTFRIYFKK